MKKAINRRRLAADRVTSRPRRTAARSWKLGETRRANKQKKPQKKESFQPVESQATHNKKKLSKGENPSPIDNFFGKKRKIRTPKKKRSRMETTGGTKQKKSRGKKTEKKIKMSERNGLSVRPQRGRVMTTTNESRNNKVKERGKRCWKRRHTK